MKLFRSIVGTFALVLGFSSVTTWAASGDIEKWDTTDSSQKEIIIDNGVPECVDKV